VELGRATRITGVFVGTILVVGVIVLMEVGILEGKMVGEGVEVEIEAEGEATKARLLLPAANTVKLRVIVCHEPVVGS